MSNHELSTDHGTVLSASSSALVVDAQGRLSFLLADYPKDQSLPVLAQVLAAVAVRADDDEWVQDMLSVFDEATRS